MAKIQKNKSYEIEHPKTGNIEVWSGDRILHYQMTYGSEVNFPAPTKVEVKVEIPIKELVIAPAKKPRKPRRKKTTKIKEL